MLELEKLMVGQRHQSCRENLPMYFCHQRIKFLVYKLRADEEQISLNQSADYQDISFCWFRVYGKYLQAMARWTKERLLKSIPGETRRGLNPRVRVCTWREITPTDAAERKHLIIPNPPLPSRLKLLFFWAECFLWTLVE